jgi:hypothetical protein
MEDDNVKQLKVKFKKPPGEGERPFLEIVNQYSSKDDCDHRAYYVEGRGFVNVTYKIREGETEIECGRCETRLDPMFVLRILAREETHWQQARERYIDEMKRLRERSRTKCENCGHMTRISRR